MSSKVVGGEAATHIQRIQWRRLGASHGGASATPGAAILDEPAVLRGRVAELEREIEQRIRQAQQQGRREGETTATQAAAQQLEQGLARVARGLQDLIAARDQMRRQMEVDLVHLSVVVARRILHRELTVDPEALVGIVRAALDKVELRELFRLRAAPSDARFLQGQLAGLGLPDRVELVADQGLEPGAILIETARGILDASVNTQLEEIDRGFADLVRRRA